MALTKFAKITIASATTTVAVGGITAFTYHKLTKETKIKDMLGERLIPFNSVYLPTWQDRATKLSKIETELSLELKKLKTQNNGEGLMDWCKRNVENKFVSNNDPVFLEVEEYCLHSIKDLSAVILEKNWTNGKNNKKLTDIKEEEVNLSDDMKRIRAQLTATNGDKDGEALKKWCAEAVEKPSKDSNYSIFLDVINYCGVVEE